MRNEDNFEKIREQAEDAFAETCAEGMAMLDNIHPVQAGVSFMLAVESYLQKFHVPIASLQLNIRIPMDGIKGEDDQMQATLEAPIGMSISESATCWNVTEALQALSMEAGDGLLGRIDTVLKLWLNVESLSEVPQIKRKPIVVTAKIAMVVASNIRVWGHWFGPSSGSNNGVASLDFWETVCSDSSLAETMKHSRLLRSMLEQSMSVDEDDLDLYLGD